MTWLWIVVVAYALNAIAIAIDKALLKKEVPHPAAYTFYICLLGGLAIVLLPFDAQLPQSWLTAGTALAAGGTFTAALFFMFAALKRADASRVTPLIGGLSPLLIFALAFWFLGERLGDVGTVAFVLILLGTVVISINLSRRQSDRQGRAVLLAVLSAGFFAVSYVLSKYLYDTNSFIAGFVWIRLAALVAAGGLLLVPSWRAVIVSTATRSASGSKVAFLVGQASGALSAVLVQWSIALASVSLINALQGLQYVFLFIIVVALHRRWPKLLNEDLTPRVYAQKVAAIALIGGGLAVLSFSGFAFIQ